MSEYMFVVGSLDNMDVARTYCLTDIIMALLSHDQRLIVTLKICNFCNEQRMGPVRCIIFLIFASVSKALGFGNRAMLWLSWLSELFKFIS